MGVRATRHISANDFNVDAYDKHVIVSGGMNIVQRTRADGRTYSNELKRKLVEAVLKKMMLSGRYTPRAGERYYLWYCGGSASTHRQYWYLASPKRLLTLVKSNYKAICRFYDSLL